jgi:Phage integrase family/Arm DNA-binding domain
MRTKLNPTFVRDAKAARGADRTIYWDEGLSGFGLMVTAAGHKSFVCQYRTAGRSRRMHFKRGLSLDEARKQARGVIGAVAKDRDPLAERRKEAAEATNTLKSIAEEYLIRAGRLRSIDQRRACLNRLIYPKFGSRQIGSIRRSEIVRLLDRIEDENGPAAADHTLAVLRRLFTWHAGRSDDFRSPIVRGMARTSPKARARQRVLTDDELRAVWKAAEALQSPFGSMLRFILLTATRRNEAARLSREEVSGAECLIPSERHKSKKDFMLPLSAAALAVLAEVPVLGRRKSKDYIFTTDGVRPLGGFSKFKRGFDEAVLAAQREQDAHAKSMPRWTLHDLRRTARSLMSRAGVAPDHAERALGHVIPGIRGTYDLHEFGDEKRRALEALAAQVERIVNPQSNVVALRDSSALVLKPFSRG